MLNSLQVEAVIGRQFMSRVAEVLRKEDRPFVNFPPARTAVAGGAAFKPIKGSVKVCLLVLGTHHCGASAFARVLNLLGCDLPNSVVHASEATGARLCESDAIRQLNDRILAATGTAWDDWHEFLPDWLTTPGAEEFRQEALAIVRGEFGSSPLFVLSDPRLCRLVPFWLGVLEAAGVRPLIISPVSSPVEMAAALQQRSGLAAGLGHLIWLRNVLDAEFASRGTARFFTSFDHLSDEWARIAGDAGSALGVTWPTLPERAAAEIEAFLADSRPHECPRPVADGDLDDPDLLDGLRSTHEILARWSAEGETAQDYPALDRIRAALNTAAPTFSRLLDTERQRNIQLESRAEAAESALADLRHRLAETESALAQRRHETEQTAGELAAVRDDLRRVTAARTEAEKVAAGLREHVALLMADVRERQARATRQAEADAAMAKQVRQVLAVLDTSRAELAARLSEAEKARAAQAAEMQQRSEDLESLRRVADKQAEASQERSRELAALEIGRAAGRVHDRGALLPWKKFRLRRQTAQLKRSGAFDAEWYLRQNPDVASAGIDPLHHYVDFGAKEGRAPCPGPAPTTGKG